MYYFCLIKRKNRRIILYRNKVQMNNTIKRIIELVVTDLDGTLLNKERKVSIKDMSTFYLLEKKKICRVIATGRSNYSAQKVIPEDFPIDFLVVSSGAGIIEWPTKNYVFSNYLKKEQVQVVSTFLIQNSVDFMIHEVIPNNHKFYYYKNRVINPDFERRCAIYDQYAVPLETNTKFTGNACQLVVVLPNKPELFEQLKQGIIDLDINIKVIRTTSPLDGDAIWMELFPAEVSKANAVSWICKHKGVDPSKTVGLGNDYNDLDLLNWVNYSFVVGNAPDNLKAIFKVVNSNENSGFTQGVMGLFNKKIVL